MSKRIHEQSTEVLHHGEAPSTPPARPKTDVREPRRDRSARREKGGPKPPRGGGRADSDAPGAPFAEKFTPWPWGLAALALILLFVYSPSLGGGFLWDDDEHFAANPAVADPAGLGAIWTSAKAIYYPLTLTTWWAVRRVFGLDPAAYRLLTLAFHALNAALFWALLRRWRVPGAPFAAALFALHPIQVESVAWATELKNTQSALLALLALLAFTRFEEALDSRAAPARAESDDGGGAPPAAATESSSSAWRWWGAALLAFAAALLSKPAVAPLPAVMVIAALWRRGRGAGESGANGVSRGGAARARRVALLSILPFFALALGWSAWTVWEQRSHSGAQGAEWALTLADRCALAGRAAWFYLARILWPHPLIFVYPRWAPDASNLLQWIAPAALAAAGAAGVWLALRGRARPWGGAAAGALAAGAASLALLSPVLGFFNIYYMRFSFVADHFAYHAVAPLFALAGAGAVALARRVAAPDRWKIHVALGILLALLAVASWRRAGAFHDEETLWRDTAERNPAAWIAWNNLGYEVARRGRAAEALSYYDKALALRPDYDDALNNRALALLTLGRAAEARASLLRAVEIRPRFPDALNNLAAACAELGDPREAVGYLERAIAIAPEVAEYHANLGVLLARQSRFEDAIRAFEKALALDPSNTEVRSRLTLLRQTLPASHP